MSSQKEGEKTAVNREDRELSPQENTAGPKETSRRHVDDLLDISEEHYRKELEQGYSGWDDAVCGWSRVAPLSCIFMTQTDHRKSKHKTVKNPTPLYADSTSPKSDSSASVAEEHRDSYSGLSNCKKSVSANQQIDSCGPAKLPVLNAMQEDMTHFLLKEKTAESPFKMTPLRPCHLSSQYSVPKSKYTMPQKHPHKFNNKAVPIKNPTFVPPIQPPQISPNDSCHMYRSKKALDGENLERKSAAKQTGVDFVENPELSIRSASLTPKNLTCQCKPHLFTPLSASPVPRYLTQCTPRFSDGKTVSQAVVRCNPIYLPGASSPEHKTA